MKKNNKNRSLASLMEQYGNQDILSKIAKEYSKEDETLFVPLSKVKFNPISIHQFFLDRSLKDLTSSIKNNGIMSPILVRVNEKGYYEVISGYKRYYVAKKLHLQEVPVAVRNIPDDLMIYLVLSRGNKKQHDNILNKTYAYEILTRDYHVSRKDIALISKTSVCQVTNILRLSKLDEEVILALKKDKISYGQARVLIGLDNQQQIEYLNQIIQNKKSVRDIEKEVREYKNPSKYSSELKEYEKDNSCSILLTEKGVTFKFNSNEELNMFLKNVLNKQK